MSLTITLRLIAPDRAEAQVGSTALSTFDPQALLVEQPLHIDPQRSIDPVAYGRRLLAALGGPALTALLDPLPRAPAPQSLVAIRTDEPQLAAIPWEYLYSGQEFVAQERLFIREVPARPEALP